MKNFLNVLWILIKWLWNALKQILLLPFYCSMPDKYNGIMYDDWLKENEPNKHK